MSPKPLRTFVVKNNRVEFFIPTKEQTCTETFPDCPNIRCQKLIHDSGVCYSAGRDPYYMVTWQAANKKHKER